MFWELMHAGSGKLTTGMGDNKNEWDSKLLPSGFFYGMQVYTTFRWPLAERWLDAHLGRLNDNAAAMGLEPLVAKDALIQKMNTLLADIPQESMVMRLTLVSDNLGYSDFFENDDQHFPSRLLLGLRTFPPALAEEPTPMRLVTRVYRRPMAQLKSADIAEPILFKQAAVRQGYHDVLFLGEDKQGDFLFVRETTIANVVVLKHSTLLIPHSVESDCLDGITQQQLNDFAPRLKLSIIRKILTLDDLRAADEIFLTNAVMGLCRVAEIVHNAETLFSHHPVDTKPVNEAFTGLRNQWIDLHTVKNPV